MGVLRDLLSHGKTFEAKTMSLEVPKKWFLHFYVVGIISSPVVVALNKTRLNVAMSLLLKFSRSCYQWLYVHVWRADSKMHVPAYALCRGPFALHLVALECCDRRTNNTTIT